MKKNILITGATGNLGRAVVDKMLGEGHRVVAIVSPGHVPIPQVTSIEADLTQEGIVADAVKKMVAESKSIDAVLLLAGGFAGGNIDHTDGSLLKKMYALNFETAFYVARPVFVQMMKQATGGRIVFVGARAALTGEDGKGSIAYGLSKAMIFKLAEYLNAEGASKNVLSTVVVPSTIDTPANRGAMPGADFSKWVKPEAIADVISFAISSQAEPLRETILKVYGQA